MHEVASPFDEHRNQSVGEEIANSVSHGMGLAGALAAAPMLIVAVAEASDLHWRYLQTLESGKSNPSLKVLCRLRKGLNCSWDELLGKDD